MEFFKNLAYNFRFVSVGKPVGKHFAETKSGLLGGQVDLYLHPQFGLCLVIRLQ